MPSPVYLDDKIYDVAIVGQGPIGLILSHLLAGQGLDVLCLDASSGQSTVPRAIVLDVQAIETLKAMDLLKEIEHTLLPLKNLHCFGPDGEKLGAIALNDRQDHTLPSSASFSLIELEKALLERSLQTSNIDLFRLHTVNEIQEETDYVTIRAHQNVTRQPLVAQARFLVGCDGKSSTVRRLCNIAMEGRNEKRRWLVTDIFDPDSYQQDFTQHPFRAYCTRYNNCFSIQRQDGTTRFEFVLPEDDARETRELLDDDQILRMVKPLMPLSEQAKVTRKHLFLAHSLLAERFWQGRIILAGDAAHSLPPFVGTGLNSGIQDAVNLSWRLGHAVKDNRHESLLYDYERERRSVAIATNEFTKRFEKKLMPDEFLNLFSRNVSIWQSRLFSKDKSNITLLVKPAVELKAGSLATDQQKHGYLTGSRFPNGMVRDQKNRHHSITDLLFGKFTFLGIGVDPSDILGKARMDFWDQWHAEIRPVTLPGGIHLTHPDTLAGIEDSSLTPILQKKDGTVLLIRPDMFIAAEFTPHNVDQVLTPLEARLAG